VVIFIIKPAQRKQDLVTVRVGAEAFPKELLGLGNLMKLVGQPIGGDGVGVHDLRVQFSGNFEPGQDFPFLAMFQMSVFGDQGMPAKAFHPISRRAQKILLLFMLLILGAFVVDATVTLIRRVARGERFYEAHRSHAYQHAAQRWGHLRVTVAVGVVNLCWLFPIALLVARGSLDGPLGVLVAYAPMVGAAFWLRAGQLSPA